MYIQMKTKGPIRWILAFLLTGALFFSCEQPGGLSAPEDPSGDPSRQADIGYSVEADGVNNEEDSRVLYFSFDEAVPDLTLAHISLTNGTGSVTAGRLSGEGSTWSLGISVQIAGNITVKITKDGIDDGVKTTAVYRKGE